MWDNERNITDCFLIMDKNQDIVYKSDKCENKHLKGVAELVIYYNKILSSKDDIDGWIIK